MDKDKIPVIPSKPEPSIDPNPVVAICGECGIEVRQVMGYVCYNSRCPIFPQVIC